MDLANLIHTGLKAHLMLCAIMVYLQNLFSRKHRFPFFCKSSEDLSPLQDAVTRMLTQNLGLSHIFQCSGTRADSPDMTKELR